MEPLFLSLAFSTGVYWHGESAQPIADVSWEDLVATGHSDTGVPQLMGT